MAKPDYLFDIGNVILFFDFEKFAKAIEADCEVPVPRLLEMIADPKSEMEASTMETEDFLKLAFETIGYRGTREAFIKAWQHIFTLNEPVAKMIERLKSEGHRMLLLSNTNQLHVDHFMNDYPVFRCFDDWVFSHEAGSAKPDPAIYEHTITKFGIDPGNTIYIDDLEPNIRAGEKFGFRAIHYVGQDLEA